MARVQPVADAARLRAGDRLLRARGRDTRRGGDPRAESLRVRVPGGGNAAALAAALVRPGRGRRGAVDCRRAGAVPDLCRDRADDDRVGAGRSHRALLRRGVQLRHLPCAGRGLFSVSRILRAVGRREMADRSALRARSRQVARRAPRLGGADLQRHRGARQPHSPVLDAAADRHPRLESPRHRRLLDAAVRRARAGGAVSGMDSELHVLGPAPPALLRSEAAKSLGVHLGWVVQTYNATEALANLIHPFWMLPLIGILGLKARDIVGYSMLQFVVHVPVVLFLVWILNYTF